MATKKTETATAEEAVQPVNESVYTAAELAAAAQSVFKVMPECVTAALMRAGKDKATISEAKEIVKKFMEKEVK